MSSSQQSTRLNHIQGTAFSIVVGLLGGSICGSVILSLCGLAGRSQTTGAEYLGYWSFGLAMIGAMYGGLLGMALGPVGYLIAVRRIGFRAATLPAAIGTIVGGFVGSLVTPGLGIATGTVGFLLGLLWARRVSSRYGQH